MGYYKILQPEAATNLITNPSFETAVTGWTAVGGSVAQSYTYQRRGAASLSVDPTTGTGDGVYYGTVSLTSGTSYTFSVDILGVASVPYTIYFANTSGTEQGTSKDFTATGRWERQSVTWVCDSTTSFRLYVVKNNSANGDAFYIDGALCVALAHDTSYFDGDNLGFLSDGYYWTGTPHASTSVRSAQERSGGQEIDLDDTGWRVQNPVGLGVPPVAHHTQPLALLPGAEYVGQKVLPRVIDLQSTFITANRDTLHSYRKDVIDLIKSSRVRGAQPFVLRYYHPSGRGPVEMRCVYDSGLEFNPNEQVEQPPVRLISNDPMVYEDGDGGASLTTVLSIADADYVVRKNAGTWANISTDFNGYVGAVELGLDGKLYLGGYFSNVGDANGDFITTYDPTANALASLSTGANLNVLGLKRAPNGDIYAVGQFTDLGDADGDYIAYWDTSASGFVSLAPLSAEAYALTFGLDGILYVGGNFTNVTDANGDYITQWGGTAFSSLDTGMNGAVWALATHPSGDIYAGGEFVTAGGGTVNGIARWDGSAWYGCGSGVAGGSADVYAIAIDRSGLVYIGGNFTSANGVSCDYVASWNGTDFSPLGTGFNGQCNKLFFGADGLLYACGLFTTAGSVSLASKTAVWNGYTWAHIDIEFPSGTTFGRSIFQYRDNLYFGYSGSGTAYGSYLNTITNSGTSKTYPVMKIKRAGGTSATVAYFENVATGKKLYCNYALLDGETLTIDLRPGRRSVTSDFFGQKNSAILKGSDFTEFFLLPGENKVSAYVIQVGSPTITASITYKLTHESVDGVAA